MSDRCTAAFLTKKKKIMGISIEEMLSDFMVGRGIATVEEINLVSDINGYSEETMNDILFARTGNRNYEQCVMDGYDRDADLDMYYML
jgi:hypothetical protein